MSQYDSAFEENLYQLRREKLQQIADIIRAQNPGISDIEAKYPNAFAFTQTIPQLRSIGHSLTTEVLEATPIQAAVAGRIVAIRVQGKAGFATLQQGGQRLQIYVRKDDVGEPLFDLYKLLDLGDHIGVIGHLMRTRTGELTLKAATITFLAKAMLALPDKFHGLSDIELRYRQRYVDLFTDIGDMADITLGPNPVQTRQPAREVFVKRAAILRAIRNFFDARGYLEVETPMLHTISGGAAARPFETHHNALDIPLKLRIAPELYLKRLVVGGFDRVYEINRNFRNEGVSTQHNPEFTMLEFYQAYANYHDLMALTKDLITTVAKEVNGTIIAPFTLSKGRRAGELVDIDLSKWTKLSMREAIIKYWKLQSWEEYFGPAPRMEDFTTDGMITLLGRLISRAEKMQEDVAQEDEQAVEMGAMFLKLFREMFRRVADEGQTGNEIATLFELLAEEHLIQPTIIYDFPLAVSPLSKVKPNEPDWVERFEFYIGGFEVGNAFSELNDPDDQRARFEAQLAEKARGDDEAMPMDDDYVRALGYGLPPTAGEGIGIDRLTMILTGSRSIRDVILFPLMRPAKPADQPGEHLHGESAE